MCSTWAHSVDLYVCLTRSFTFVVRAVTDAADQHDSIQELLRVDIRPTCRRPVKPTRSLYGLFLFRDSNLAQRLQRI